MRRAIGSTGASASARRVDPGRRRGRRCRAERHPGAARIDGGRNRPGSVTVTTLVVGAVRPGACALGSAVWPADSCFSRRADL